MGFLPNKSWPKISPSDSPGQHCFRGAYFRGDFEALSHAARVIFRKRLFLNNSSKQASVFIVPSTMRSSLVQALIERQILSEECI